MVVHCCILCKSIIAHITLLFYKWWWWWRWWWWWGGGLHAPSPTSTRQVANGRWHCWGQSWWPCCSTWWPRCRQKQVLGISGHCGTTVSSFQIFQISKLLPFFHALTTLTTPWGTSSSPWHGCPSSFSFLRRWCCQNSPAETAWGTGWWVSSNISQERKRKNEFHAEMG